MAPIVPSFFLYGEPPREVDDHFLHLEALDDRSRPNNWNIRAHAHASLNHVFHLVAGSGVLQAETLRRPFEAPCLIVIPARTIHGFEFADETRGTVLTVSETFLREQLVRHSEFSRLFAAPRVLPMQARDREAQWLESTLQCLARELAWHAPGHSAAIESQLQALLVAVLRIAHSEQHAKHDTPRKDAELVARFAELLENSFHTNRPIAEYARTLGVSLARLRTACMAVAHRSPNKLLQDRIVLEAKRVLIYSNMSVSEAAYHLGFDDPAYFTRFFTKCTGQSPRRFRQRASDSPDA